MIDARGIPTTRCPQCMSPFFKIVAQFDPFDYDIGMYFTDAECAKCGALVTAPTPIDHPDFNNKHKQGE